MKGEKGFGLHDPRLSAHDDLALRPGRAGDFDSLHTRDAVFNDLELNLSRSGSDPVILGPRSSAELLPAAP